MEKVKNVCRDCGAIDKIWHITKTNNPQYSEYTETIACEACGISYSLIVSRRANISEVMLRMLDGETIIKKNTVTFTNGGRAIFTEIKPESN